MRRLILPALLLAAPAGATAGDQWFRIAGPDGATIGWQRETSEAAGHGRRETSERQLAYRVDGHAPVRQYLRREVQRDAAGAIIATSLMAGPDARRARPVGAGQPVDDVPLAAILAGLAEAPMPPGLALLRGADGSTWVERRREGRFDAAWQVDLAPSGTLRAVIQHQPGSAMRFEPADSRPHSVGGTLPHAMIPSLHDIPRAARSGHLRYVFGLPPGIGLPLPQTGEQRVTLQDGAIRVDICASCGPGLPADPATLARWTRPAPWLESEAPELRRAATHFARGHGSQLATMQALARLARRRLAEVDYAGHATARGAWRARRGDCTEDALLLAALARAAGIPALVASGLVYDRERFHGTRDAFLPHAWTLAHVDGAWRSFDISLDGFDATHIALAIGEGDPATITAGWRLAALLDWRAMAEVRRAPPPAPGPAGPAPR